MLPISIFPRAQLLPTLPEDPIERLHGIATFLQSASPQLRLDTQLHIVAKPFPLPTCMGVDPFETVRVSNVADELLQFCTQHAALINAQPELWQKIHTHILFPLNERTKKKYAAAIAFVSTRLIQLENRLTLTISKPVDLQIPLPDRILSWIQATIKTPCRYYLEFQKCGFKGERKRELFLYDRVLPNPQRALPAFSLDIGYHKSQLSRCILLSKKILQAGSLTKARVCWDFLSNQGLIRKSNGIDLQARHIIKQIAQWKLPSVVPIPIIVEEPKWRMYEMLCQGDLFDLYRKHTWDVVRKQTVAHQLLSMLSELHQQTFTLSDGSTCPAFHGDIKPENILYHEKRLVLTDFGSTSPAIISGTYWYASPQLLHALNAQRKRLSCTLDCRQAEDVWALGIMLLQLLREDHAQILPCMENVVALLSKGQTVNSIDISQTDVDRDLTTQKPGELDPALDLLWICVTQMLRVDPKTRISAQMAYEAYLNGTNRERLDPA